MPLDLFEVLTNIIIILIIITTIVLMWKVIRKTRNVAFAILGLCLVLNITGISKVVLTKKHFKTECEYKATGDVVKTTNYNFTIFDLVSFAFLIYVAYTKKKNIPTCKYVENDGNVK